MKAKFRWAALTALLASTLGFAAVPVELAIDFAAETAAEWGKTKGTELGQQGVQIGYSDAGPAL